MPAYNRITADLLTEAYRISCRIEAGNTGTIGLLNDPISAIFPVEDAYISRLSEPAKIVEHYPTIFIAKATLALILIARREEMGPQGLARGGYTQVVPTPVLMTTPSFEIHGQLEPPGKLDVGALLGTSGGKFLPAFKVSVIAIAYPDIPYTSEVLLMNRSMITLIAPDQGGKTGG